LLTGSEREPLTVCGGQIASSLYQRDIPGVAADVDLGGRTSISGPGGRGGREIDEYVHGRLGADDNLYTLHERALADLQPDLILTQDPVVLGAGERLFGGTSDRKLIRLVKTETVGDLARLIYESVGE
jgi:hypothetical protein